MIFGHWFLQAASGYGVPQVFPCRCGHLHIDQGLHTLVSVVIDSRISLTFHQSLKAVLLAKIRRLKLAEDDGDEWGREEVRLRL